MGVTTRPGLVMHITARRGHGYFCVDNQELIDYIDYPRRATIRFVVDNGVVRPPTPEEVEGKFNLLTESIGRGSYKPYYRYICEQLESVKESDPVIAEAYKTYNGEL